VFLVAINSTFERNDYPKYLLSMKVESFKAIRV